MQVKVALCVLFVTVLRGDILKQRRVKIHQTACIPSSFLQSVLQHAQSIIHSLDKTNTQVAEKPVVFNSTVALFKNLTMLAMKNALEQINTTKAQPTRQVSELAIVLAMVTLKNAVYIHVEVNSNTIKYRLRNVTEVLSHAKFTLSSLKNITGDMRKKQNKQQQEQLEEITTFLSDAKTLLNNLQNKTRHDLGGKNNLTINNSSAMLVKYTPLGNLQNMTTFLKMAWKITANLHVLIKQGDRERQILQQDKISNITRMLTGTKSFLNDLFNKSAEQRPNSFFSLSKTLITLTDLFLHAKNMLSLQISSSICSQDATDVQLILNILSSISAIQPFRKINQPTKAPSFAGLRKSIEIILGTINKQNETPNSLIDLFEFVKIIQYISKDKPPVKESVDLEAPEDIQIILRNAKGALSALLSSTEEKTGILNFENFLWSMVTLSFNPLPKV